MDSTSEGVLNWPSHFPEKPVYVWIIGGSFQGKSLIATSLAVSLGIPHVINTDLIRNLLRSQRNNPPDWLGTSTYLLSEEDLERQFEAVSDLLAKLLAIYRKRGESAIIEGMHVSLDLLLAEGIRPDTLIFGIDNTIRYEERILSKVRTVRLNGRLDRYRDYGNRVLSIHRDLLMRVKIAAGQIMKFDNLHLIAEQIAKDVRNRFPFIARSSQNHS